MAPEPTNLHATSNVGDKQKNLDQEIKELISALMSRLGSIQRSPNPGDSASQEDEDPGVRIITLAGSNLGATMRGEADDKPKPAGPDDLALQLDQDDFATYVNSNFQAINNSIMLGGSYETKDPGVHLDILDDVEDDEAAKHGKKVRRTKHRGRGNDHHSMYEDKTSDGEQN